MVSGSGSGSGACCGVSALLLVGSCSWPGSVLPLHFTELKAPFGACCSFFAVSDYYVAKPISASSGKSCRLGVEHSFELVSVMFMLLYALMDACNFVEISILRSWLHFLLCTSMHYGPSAMRHCPYVLPAMKITDAMLQANLSISPDFALGSGS